MSADTWTVGQGCRVLCGDALQRLREMPDASVDSVLTDPPYDLAFMGRGWDRTGIAFRAELWGEALRVLKPGGHILAFGGTRTYHRMAVAIEDAGFEIRDCLVWMYGSGMPKSRDVGKALDAHAGAVRKVLAEGKPVRRMIPGADQSRTGRWIKDNGRTYVPTASEPATDAAQEWDGWGTALKPAHEPIVLARKPLVGTVAENVLRHGVGGLNVAGCRVAGSANGGVWSAEHGHTGRQAREVYHGSAFTGGRRVEADGGMVGRWPANVLLDPSAAALLDTQSGELTSGTGAVKRATAAGSRGNALGTESRALGTPMVEYGDTGGASRFFYTAKTSGRERHAGCGRLFWRREQAAPAGVVQVSRAEYDALPANARAHGNIHPTVKPVSLMRWLARLVTPRGGVVLDLFAGSGSTGVAAEIEGFRSILIDLLPEHCTIIRHRVAAAPLIARGLNALDRINPAPSAATAGAQPSLWSEDDKAGAA